MSRHMPMVVSEDPFQAQFWSLAQSWQSHSCTAAPSPPMSSPATSRHLPPGPITVYPVVGGGGGGGGAEPANCAVYLVKSHAPCGTLLQTPEVTPLLSGGLHCRSRLTAQKVYRLSPWLVA